MQTILMNVYIYCIWVSKCWIDMSKCGWMLRSVFIVCAMCAAILSIWMYVPFPACVCSYACHSVYSAEGVVKLLVCLTLAMGWCRWGPTEARWGLWSVTQSPQQWIKLMLQIPSLQLSCAPGGRTTFEQRDLVPARGRCLFNMCFECYDWLIPLTGRRKGW